MANPFVKAWKYVMALFNAKIDEHADPKVQIQQAIEDAQRQHQALTQQAAQVIGNQRQLEMRLNRQLADIEKLQVNVRQAVTLADQATAAGDAAKATEYNNAAEAFAAQLVTAEQSVEDLKALHDQALGAAAQAKKAVEQNAMVLQQKIAERTKLLSQLEQAKMQEQVSKSLRSMSEIAAPGTTPSLDEVRDKIERRYANALGQAELAQNSVQGRMIEVEQAGVQMAGHSRLEQIRASMRGEALPAGGATQPRDPRLLRRRHRRPRPPRSPSASRGTGERMAVQSGRGAGWRTLLLRGLDTASDVSELVAQKISAATDPRERQLRRRRRALRWGLIFTAGCVFWGVVTAILAAWGWFALLLEITGGVAVVQAMIATLLLIRYRWLQSRSAARAAADQHPASAAAEFGGTTGDVRARRLRAGLLLACSGVMERGNMLPDTEIRDLTAAAKQSSAAMAATAAEVVSMERAAHGTPQSRSYLAPTINAFTAQLSAGVRQYNEMVTAAAQLVSSANADVGAALVASRQRYRDELAGATDRLVGWSQAFDELGGLPRRA